MNNRENREFDIVVFGATGFSGKLLAEYLVRNYGNDVKLALGGRNQKKLENVRRSLPLQNIPILIADSTDLQALTAIAERARCIATTVGPYAKYGTPLVEACARSGTSYCDLTGEAGWHATMFNRFERLAKETGARIVPQAGFDSVPSDIGTFLAVRTFREKFNRDPDMVDMYVKLRGGGLQGGTVDTIMNEIGNYWENNRLLKNSKRGAPPLPRKGRTEQVWPWGITYCPAAKSWGFFFFMAGANMPYVTRSNGRLGYSQRLKYSERMVFPSFLQALGAYCGLLLFGALLVLPPTRWVLQHAVLPSPGQGPSQEVCESASYTMIFRASGGGDHADVSLDAVGDASCISTTCCLGEVAMALSTAPASSLKSSGGVMTAAAAMGETLLKRLNDTPLFKIQAKL